MTDEEKEAKHLWLKRRQKGLGGSDIGAILGVDRYRDALDVFLDKTQPPVDIDSPDMERGRMLEPVVSQKYMTESGRKLKPGKFRRHRKYPWLIGNPDRIILATGKGPHDDPVDGTGVLEIKTANRWVWRHMEAEGLPQSYLLQLQHYLAICGVEWGAFAVLCPDPWRFVKFDVSFDEELFEQVAEVLERFWKDNVLRGVPPVPAQVDWGDAPPTPGEEIIKITDSGWDRAIELYREATAMSKLGEEYKGSARDMMKKFMTEGAGVYEGGGARVYYRDQTGRKTFMQRELGAIQPLDPIAMATILEKMGLDLDVIETLFDEARLDLQKFEKIGKPFSTVRMYDSKEA